MDVCVSLVLHTFICAQAHCSNAPFASWISRFIWLRLAIEVVRVNSNSAQASHRALHSEEQLASASRQSEALDAPQRRQS